ncbi:hypothetical protein ACFL7M_08335 [Thermodesulfobacteriota bacterium]
MELLKILPIAFLFGFLLRGIAIKRGGNPAVWFALGFAAGPFALPFVYFIRKKQDPL